MKLKLLALLLLLASPAYAATIDTEGSISGGSGGGLSGDVTITSSGERISGGSGSEYIDFNDSGDGTLTFGGAAGTNNESMRIDFESTANQIGIGSDTGVTNLSLGSIDLRTDTISSPTGTLTLSGVGGSFNENISLDCETTSNRCSVGSTTGARLTFGTVGVEPLYLADVGIFIGANSNGKLWFTATGNDNLQLGMTVNSSANSGYFSIMEIGDMAVANRSPSTLAKDPTLRIYSTDDTQANDYVEITHDKANAYIGVGSGNLNVTGIIVANSDITSTDTGDIGWSVVDGSDNTACTSQCTYAAVFGFNLAAGATAPVLVGPSDATADICMCAGAN